MSNTTTTTTNETNPLAGLVSHCCGQDHKIGEFYHIDGREKIGYCSLCDEPVKFLTPSEYEHCNGGGEDRYPDSYWEDVNEMGCW